MICLFYLFSHLPCGRAVAIICTCGPFEGPGSWITVCHCSLLYNYEYWRACDLHDTCGPDPFSVSFQFNRLCVLQMVEPPALCEHLHHIIQWTLQHSFKLMSSLKTVDFFLSFFGFKHVGLIWLNSFLVNKEKPWQFPCELLKVTLYRKGSHHIELSAIHIFCSATMCPSRDIRKSQDKTEGKSHHLSLSVISVFSSPANYHPSV